MRCESCGYDFCGKHSSFLNDIPPKSKSNKIESFEKNKIISTQVYIYFFTILINKLQFIVKYSSRKFNSPLMSGELCGNDICGRHSIFLNGIPPKIKITTLSRLRKKFIATRVLCIF